jgi:EmrB/QacA subfamily drug resistance transporter
MGVPVPSGVVARPALDTTAAAPRGRALSSPWAVFAVAGIGIFITTLDLSIVNVAYAEIARSFPEVPSAEISWVVTAYTILYGSLLVAGGRTADRLGRKRVFLAGTAIFVVGSVLCGAAPGLGWLVAGRAVQGVGGALLTPATLGLLLGAFPLERRTQVVAMWGGVGALGVASGPTLGALLISAFGWRSAFFVNVPIGALALVGGWYVLRETPREEGARPDYVGAALFTLGVAALVLGVSQGSEWGWGDPRVVAAFVAAAALLPAFVWRSTHHPAPIIDLGLFRHRSFALANWASLAFGASFSALVLNNVLFLRTVWHYGVLKAGLFSVLAPIVVAVVSVPAGRLASRIGFRAVLVTGPLVVAAGELWYLTQLTAEPQPWTHWIPGSIVLGIGIGLTFPVLTAAAAATLPRQHFALGGAVNNTARQVGAALGVAVLVAVQGSPESPDELLASFRRGWAFALAAALVAAAISLRQPAGGRRATPAPDADEHRVGDDAVVGAVTVTAVADRPDGDRPDGDRPDGDRPDGERPAADVADARRDRDRPGSGLDAAGVDGPVAVP